MDEIEIPGMLDFGEKLAAEIEARKSAAEEKVKNEMKEQLSETDHP